MKIHPGRSAIVKLSVIVVFVGSLAVIALMGGHERADASAAGPAASHTGAPGEQNCTSCHVEFPVNSGGGSVVITGIPHDYLPGQQVPVTVTTTHTTAVLFGFQLTAIDSLGRRAGAFSLPVQMPPKTQIIFGDVPVGNPREYVEQTNQGLFTQGVFGSNTWNFTWTAPPQRVGKISFYAAGNGADGFGTPTGDHIYTTSKASLSGSAISNFNGDLASDIAVWRPSTGVWYNFSISTNTYGQYIFGLQGDRITPGDYDGDGTTDFSVWRASTSVWYIQRSTLGFTASTFGLPGDLPAPGDYDGDGKTDIAVYRPSTGVWYVLRSTGGFTSTLFGLNGDKPTQGDYDADGKTDIAVFRPSTGVWYILRSTTGASFAMLFGISEDKPVQADYDGDGRTDIAVFRPSTGVWYFANSTGSFTAATWGFGTDIPTPADYDSDGKADIAVWRPSTGVWYLFRSSDNSFYAALFGLSEDVPIPSGYIPQ